MYIYNAITIKYLWLLSNLNAQLSIFNYDKVKLHPLFLSGYFYEHAIFLLDKLHII
jgi:hypothetical protein